MDKSFKFKKRERIRSPQDFRRVMKSGRRKRSPNFVVFIQKNENLLPRLGIVVKKEVGRAAFRNRMKRYIREFFRLHKHQIKDPYDIIVTIRKGCSLSRFGEAEQELKRLLVL